MTWDRMLRLSVCAAALLVVAAPAIAQDQSADSGDSGGGGIETVVVTATKRAELAQNVPISMNVFDEQQINNNNFSDLKDLSTQIPGVTYFQTPTIPAFSMRGFASASSNPASDQTVSVYTDGIYEGRAQQFAAPFFDVNRVEVLRGPQGALLGKNTSAGAISIVTNDPTDTFESGFTASYLADRQGTDDFGYVSGPLTDDLNGRIAVRYIGTTEGWLHNSATGTDDPTEDTLEGRISLDWHPAEGADIVTKIEYSNMDDYGRPAASFPATVPITSVESYNRDVQRFPLGFYEGHKLGSFLGSSTGTFSLGDLTLVSVTGYSEYRGDNASGGGASNPEVLVIALDEHYSQASQELRLLSPTGGTFEWIAGAYFDYSAYDAMQTLRYDVLGGFINGQGHSTFSQHARTYSVYATGTWHILDDLDAVIGARWTRIGKSGHYQLFQDFGPPLGYVPGTNLDAHFQEDHFDPSATLQYHVTNKIMTYASWSLGSKAGAFQGTNDVVTPTTFALKPERSQNWEVGAKTSFADWLTFDVSLYQLTMKNLQVGQYVGNPPMLVNVNAASARSRGVEWVTDIRPSDNLNIDFTGSYIDGSYLNYPGAPCTYAQLQAGCVNGSVNAAGEPLAGISMWSFSVSGHYVRPLGHDLQLVLDPDIDFRSRYNIDAGVFNPYFGWQDGFAKVNLRVAVGADDGSWTLAFLGRNLFNKLTLNGAYPWGAPFVAQPTAVAMIDEGRSIAIQYSMKFD